MDDSALRSRQWKPMRYGQSVVKTSVFGVVEARIQTNIRKTTKSFVRQSSAAPNRSATEPGPPAAVDDSHDKSAQCNDKSGGCGVRVGEMHCTSGRL
ncbi:hypothetical protein MRX96_055752 [Rhipicephalus microplus]